MKRYPAVLNLNINNNFNLSESVNKEYIEDSVINETYKAIEYGVKYNRNKAEIFQIDNTRAVIKLKRSQWKDTLNNVILPYFIKKENYECCANIKQNLISKL